MALNSKELIKLGIKVLITTTLLILVFSRINLQNFWQTVRSARWQYLLAVWGVTVIIFWIQSIKMQLILKKLDCNVDAFTIFGVSAITSLYGMVIPGMLSVSVKWYILKRNTGKGSIVLSSMVYNQLSGMVVITVFGLAALIITNPTAILTTNPISNQMFTIICGVLLVLILLTTILLLHKRTGSKIMKGIKLPLKLLPIKINQKGQEILDQIAVFQSVGWRFHLAIALITIIDSLVCGVITYLLAAKGANVTAPLGVFVWLSSVVYVLRRVPISIANLGVREAALAFFLSIYGVETSASILMSMILFSSLVFIAAIGAIFQIYWSLHTGQKIIPSAKS